MITALGYDAATAVLEIEFRNGSIYRYFCVKPSDYRDLLASSSKGKFFQARIERVYRGQCIEGPTRG